MPHPLSSNPSRRHSLFTAIVISLLVTGYPLTPQAQPTTPLRAVLPAPVRPLEPDTPTLPPPPRPTPAITHRQPTQPAQPPVELTDQDLADDLKLTERILNQAMLQEDWSTLRRVMRFYPWMAGVDPILRDYVHGALLRHDGRLAEAIALYRQLVAQHPDLGYVRLELATMLMEDRQFAQSDAELADLRLGSLEPAAQRSVMLYRQALAQQRRWNFRLGAGTVYSNNVNSANRDPMLYLPVATRQGPLWVPFAKGRDALPKADWGLKYSSCANVERNLGGHHYYTLGADIDGTAYRVQRDYNDRSLTLRGGYKWQDATRWFAATPQAGRSWMGSRRYSHNRGLSLEYGWRPTPGWQLMGAWLWLKRGYDDRAYAAYDGHLDVLSLTAIRVFSPALLAYASVGLQREAVAAGEYTYRFPWAQMGVVKTFGQMLGTRLSARYGRQAYKAPYALFLNQRRRDHELRVDASVWTPDFKIAGLEPKLNLSYLKITSNLPMYARDRTEVSLMLERRF
ncbi:surface lipoprotein assembly modifier [Achromobacter ruhlandii]|uniref:surface lipoprotein assembly modifier n=1 Tax=Achromobacter ruhlandii TaxID=72557 RepID=UPI003B9BFE58